MGDGMARNLIKGGRDVVVWNRTGSKAIEFSEETGCETAPTPKEVGKIGARGSLSFFVEAAGEGDFFVLTKVSRDVRTRMCCVCLSECRSIFPVSLPTPLFTPPWT